MATITNGGGGGGGERKSRVGHTCTYMVFDVDHEDEDTARTLSQESTPTTTATASSADTNDEGTTARNPKASSGDDFSFFDEASIYGAFLLFVCFCLLVSDE
jgi:hypothetical protein